MPTSKFSKGYKKKPGSTPPQGPPPAPPSHSGGTSGDLSIPGYTPSTPTTPYNPSAPPTPVQQQIRHKRATPSTSTANPLADQYLLSRLVDLVTPGPTAAEIAQAASTLGVKPKALSAGVSSAAGGVSAGIKELGRDVAEGVKEATKLPDHRVVRAFGHKTLGTPTLRQVSQAYDKGQLGVNRKGKLTVPATRHAAQGLAAARKEYRTRAVPHVSGVPNEDQRRFAISLSKHSKLPLKLAAEWALQEGGGWGSDGVSGGEAGEQNWLGVGYPGEPTAMSRSHYFNGVTPEQAGKNTALWLEGKIGGEFDYHAADSIIGISRLAKSGASEEEIRRYIEGPSAWGTGQISQSGVTVSGGKAPPAITQQLQAASRLAASLGIPTHQAKNAEPEKPPWLLAGGPKNVKHAVEVVGKEPLKKWLKPTNSGTAGYWRNIATLNPVFAGQLVKLAKATGEPIVVTSGYRSTEDQEAIDPGTNPAAPPGYSAHQFGMAADTEMSQRQAELAPQFGLEHGAAGPGVADPPHTELTDMGLIKKAMQYGPIRSGYAPDGWQSVGDLGSFTAPANLAEGGESYGGGAATGAAIGGALPTASGGGAPSVAAQKKQGIAPAVSLGQVPISSLLDVHSPLPRAFQQFELGEAPEEEGSGVDEGTIARILRGRRR